MKVAVVASAKRITWTVRYFFIQRDNGCLAFRVSFPRVPAEITLFSGLCNKLVKFCHGFPVRRSNKMARNQLFCCIILRSTTASERKNSTCFSNRKALKNIVCLGHRTTKFSKKIPTVHHLASTVRSQNFVH